MNHILREQGKKMNIILHVYSCTLNHEYLFNFTDIQVRP